LDEGGKEAVNFAAAFAGCGDRYAVDSAIDRRERKGFLRGRRPPNLLSVSSPQK